MSDEFESMMTAEFGADLFAEDDETSIAPHGVLPPSVDDHSAVHLLEAEVQLTAFLYAQGFVGDYTEAVCPELGRCLLVGLGSYTREVFPDEMPELGSPEDIEWMAWVRLAAGQAALGLEAFLDAHGIPKVTVYVHLTNHGWRPFTIRSSNA